MLLAGLLLGCPRVRDHRQGRGYGPAPASSVSGARRPSEVIIPAAAEYGVDASDLGRAYDMRFRAIGPRGPTLFPHSGRPRKIPRYEFRHEVVKATTSAGLAANASAWGIGDLQAEVSGSRRFASFRAVQIEYVLELDDTTPLGAVPPGTAFYPWRLYFGRRYEELFWGSATDFTLDVVADLEVAQVGVGAFAAKHKLEHRFVGVGVVGDAKSLFARTPQQLQQHYSAGPPVPILVEYRAVGASTPPTQQIGWSEAASPTVIVENVHGNDTCSKLGNFCVRVFCTVRNTSSVPATARVELAVVGKFSEQKTTSLLPQQAQTLSHDFMDVTLLEDWRSRITCKVLGASR